MSGPQLPDLTPAQSAAVGHVDGPLLVLAGPGSGKTRVVTRRIAHLLQQGIFGDQIVALTFTNKAADEMRQRLETQGPSQGVWLSTFHRFCAHVLREHASWVGLEPNFTIYDTENSHKTLRRVIDESDVPCRQTSPEQLARAISQAKNDLITHQEYPDQAHGVLGKIVSEIYPSYQQRLLASNAVDFDDLLLLVANVLRDHPELRESLDERYRYILVDEYQDTNRAQYCIVRALSVKHPNLAVTGDPDQSIYGWRGASLDNILDFEKDFPNAHVVRLEMNYRSTKRILHVADSLIANNKRRLEKSLYTDNPNGTRVDLTLYPNQTDEAESIAARIASDIASGTRRPRDFAIFYRVNALSRTLEKAFSDQGIPYQIIRGVEFYQRAEIKDVLAHLQLLNNPRDDVALLRVINRPARGIGKTTIQKLSEFANHHGISLFDAARQCGTIASISKRLAVKVAKFVAMMDLIAESAEAPIEEIIGNVLSHSAYRDLLVESDSKEDEERLANIEELLTAARQFDEQNPGYGHLEEYLEQVALVNDTDDWEDETDRVTLMTMHAAKGLEFPIVFIIAVEHGILPHERSRNDPDQLEEERRLLFVGITRAMEELSLCYVHHRDYRGIRRRAVPSAFLMELPRDEMCLNNPTEYQPIDPSDESSWLPASSKSVQPSSPSALPPGTVMTAADLLRRDTEISFEPANTEPAIAEHPVENDLSGEPHTNDSGKQPCSKGDSLNHTTDPNAFVIGMIVSHPEHGLGKVIALSGSTSRRIATIQFFQGRKERTFHLATSPLASVGSPS